MVLCFNSIKVRLNPPALNDPGTPQTFQFHKGTIKPCHDTTGNLGCHSFNSIKVRLNPSYRIYPMTSTKFQFHKGTIKPLGGCGCCLHICSFNSIKVRLNLVGRVTAECQYDGFNSIKVRLNHAMEQKSRETNKFQFHKGTIKPASAAANEIENLVSIP